MKCALIGLGFISTTIMMACQEHGIDIVCVSDSVQGKKVENIQYYSDYKNMLAMHPHLDLVIIATQPDSHYEIAKFVLNKKINILVEKPITMNINDLLKLKEISENNNCLLLTSFHAMYANDLIYYCEHKKELEMNMGNLIHFRCEFYDPYFIDNQFEIRSLKLGGSYLDSAVNALSVLSQIIEVNHLKITNHQIISNQSIVIKSHTCYHDQKELKGEILTDWTLSLNFKATKLTFEHGQIILDHSNQIIKTTGSNPQMIEVDFKRNRLDNHYSNLYRDVSQMLQNKRDNLQKSMLIHQLLLDIN